MVLFDEVQSLDVTGPLEVFTGANTWRTERGHGSVYDIRTASLGGGMVRTSSGLRVVPDEDLREFPAPRRPGGACLAALPMAAPPPPDGRPAPGRPPDGYPAARPPSGWPLLRSRWHESLGFRHCCHSRAQSDLDACARC